MKALFIKDIQAIRTFLIFIVIFSLANCIPGSSLGMYGILYVLLLPITLINQDELTHWNRLSCMMPISSTAAVLEKYLLVYIMLFISIALCFISLAVGAQIFNYEIGFKQVCSLLVSMSGVLFLIAISMPFMFLVKTQVGRTITLMVTCLIFGVAIGLTTAGVLFNFDSTPTTITIIKLVAVIVGAIVLNAISLPVTIAIYKNKDK